MVLSPENVADVIKSKSKQLRLSAQQLAKSHPSREEIRVKIKEIWRHVQIMDEAFKKCRRLLNESDHAPLVFKLEHSRKELMRSRKGHAKAIRILYDQGLSYDSDEWSSCDPEDPTEKECIRKANKAATIPSAGGAATWMHPRAAAAAVKAKQAAAMKKEAPNSLTAAAAAIASMGSCAPPTKKKARKEQG